MAGAVVKNIRKWHRQEHRAVTCHWIKICWNTFTEVLFIVNWDFQKLVELHVLTKVSSIGLKLVTKWY